MNTYFVAKTNIDSSLESFEKGYISLEEAASQIHYWGWNNSDLLSLVPKDSPINNRLYEYRKIAKAIGIDIFRVDQIKFVIRENGADECILKIDSFGEISMTALHEAKYGKPFHVAGKLTIWNNIFNTTKKLIIEHFDKKNTQSKLIGQFSFEIYGYCDDTIKLMGSWTFGEDLPKEIDVILEQIKDLSKRHP